MLWRLFLVGLITMLLGSLPAQPAAAAGAVTVEGDGISPVLLDEFRAITDKSLEFYQAVYNYVPKQPVRIVVVADEAGFARRLEQAGYTHDEAVRLAKASGGISVGNKGLIVVPADKNTRFLTRIRTVTHELFHHIQHELAGNVAAHKWLTEGSAILAEQTLTEWLGQGSRPTFRLANINLLVNASLSVDPSDIVDSTKWTSLMEQKLYPYQTAALMTDYLLQQTAPSATVAYFKQLGHAKSRDLAFQHAFGRSHAQFVADYRQYFARLQADKGKIFIDPEGAVEPSTLAMLQQYAAVAEQTLRRQGWNLRQYQRFAVVADQEAFAGVLKRERPQWPASAVSEVTAKATIISLDNTNHVFNVAKLDANQPYSPLMPVIVRDVLAMTCQPARPDGIKWLYDGTVKYLTAQIAEQAGGKNLAAFKQEWQATLKAAGQWPSLAELANANPGLAARYGQPVIDAVAALAVCQLAAQYGEASLLRYFQAVRDLNDAARAYTHTYPADVTLDLAN